MELFVTRDEVFVLT